MLRAALWGFDKHPSPSLPEFDMKFFICFPGNKTIWKLKWQVSEIAVDIVEVLNPFLFIQTTACEFENQLFQIWAEFCS